MRECPPSSLDPVALSAALAPHSHPSPSPSETQKSTPGANTDSSEASNAGYFSASSRSASRHSLLGASASSLPSIGSYCLNQQAYIEAVVDELETCVERRSLVKLKLCPGTSFFLAPKPTGAFSLAAEEKGWTVEDVEGWKVRLACPLSATSELTTSRRRSMGRTRASPRISRSPFRALALRTSVMYWWSSSDWTCRMRRRTYTSSTSIDVARSTLPPLRS